MSQHNTVIKGKKNVEKFANAIEESAQSDEIAKEVSAQRLRSEDLKKRKRQPTSEKIWLRYVNEKGKVFYITSKKDSRDWYFAYDENWNKLGKNKNPTELEKLFKG